MLCLSTRHVCETLSVLSCFPNHLFARVGLKQVGESCNALNLINYLIKLIKDLIIGNCRSWEFVGIILRGEIGLLCCLSCSVDSRVISRFNRRNNIIILDYYLIKLDLVVV